MPSSEDIGFKLKGSALQNLTTTNTNTSSQSTPKSAVSEVYEQQTTNTSSDNSSLLQGHALSKVFDELDKRMNNIETKYLVPMLNIQKQMLDTMRQIKDGVNSRLETISKHLLKIHDMIKKVFGEHMRLTDEAAHGDKSLKLIRMLSHTWAQQINKMKEMYMDPKAAETFNLHLMGYLSKKSKLFGRLFAIEEKEQRVGRKPAVFTLQIAKVIEAIPTYLDKLSNNLTKTVTGNTQAISKLIEKQIELHVESNSILEDIRECVCATAKHTLGNQNPIKQKTYIDAKAKSAAKNEASTQKLFRSFLVRSQQYYKSSEQGELRTIQFEKNLLQNTSNLKTLSISFISMMMNKSSMFWKVIKGLGAILLFRGGMAIARSGPVAAIASAIGSVLSPVIDGVNTIVKKLFPNFHQTMSEYLTSSKTFIKKYFTGDDVWKNWTMVIFGAIIKAWHKVIGPAVASYLTIKYAARGIGNVFSGTQRPREGDMSPEAESARRILASHNTGRSENQKRIDEWTNKRRAERSVGYTDRAREDYDKFVKRSEDITKLIMDRLGPQGNLHTPGAANNFVASLGSIGGKFNLREYLLSLQDPNGTPDEKLAKMRGELGKDQTQKYIKLMLEKSLRQEDMNRKLIDMMNRTGNRTGGVDSSNLIQGIKSYATDPFVRATTNAGLTLKAQELKNRAQLRVKDSIQKLNVIMQDGYRNLSEKISIGLSELSDTTKNGLVDLKDSIVDQTKNFVKLMPRKIAGGAMSATGRLMSGIGLGNLGGEWLQRKGGELSGGGENLGGSGSGGGGMGTLSTVLGAITKLGGWVYIAYKGITTLYEGLKTFIFPMFNDRKTFMESKGKKGSLVDITKDFVKGLALNAFNMVRDGIKNLPAAGKMMWDIFKGVAEAIGELLIDWWNLSLSNIIGWLGDWAPQSWKDWAASTGKKLITDADKEKQIQEEIAKQKAENEKKKQEENNQPEGRTGMGAAFEAAGQAAEALGGILKDVQGYFKGDFKKDMMKASHAMGSAIGTLGKLMSSGIKGLIGGTKDAATGLLGGVGASLKSFYTGFFGNEGTANKFFDSAINYATEQGYDTVAGILKAARNTSVKDVLESTATAQAKAAAVQNQAANTFSNAVDKQVASSSAVQQNAEQPKKDYLAALKPEVRTRIEALEKAELELMKVSFDGLKGGGIEGKKRTMQAEAQLKKLREQKKRILEETGSTETYKQIETSRTIDAATKNVDTNSFERGQGQGINKGSNGQPAGAINSSTPPASTNTPPAQPQPATTSTTGGGEGSVARTINSQTDMVRMIIPQFRRIGDQFGWRVHPITHTRKFHKGIDIPAPEGSPIYSPMSGRIVYAQNISKAPRTGGGNAIRINHQQGLDTVYMHLSKFNVASGQMVNKGQLIGYAGSTGGSTGSHLHFQVERNGIPVDPTNLVQYMGGTPAAGDDAPIAKLRTDFPVGSSAAKMAAGAGDDLAINLNKDKMLANALGGAVSGSNIGQNNIIVVNGGNSMNAVSSKSSNNPVIGGQGNGGLMNYYLGVV